MKAQLSTTTLQPLAPPPVLPSVTPPKVEAQKQTLDAPTAPSTTAQDRGGVRTLGSEAIPASLTTFFSITNFSKVLEGLSQGRKPQLHRDYVLAGPDALPVQVQQGFTTLVQGLSKAAQQSLRNLVSASLTPDDRRAAKGHPASQGPATAAKNFALISGEASALGGLPVSKQAKDVAAAVFDGNAKAVDSADRDLWIHRLALAQPGQLPNDREQLCALFDALKVGHRTLPGGEWKFEMEAVRATFAVQKQIVDLEIGRVKGARDVLYQNLGDPAAREAYDVAVADALARMKHVATPDPARSYGGWTLEYVQPLLDVLSEVDRATVLRNELGR